MKKPLLTAPHSYAPRGKRYIEPDPKDAKYKDVVKRYCTKCERLLPLHEDFFSDHSVHMNGKVYHYRRPDCRTCAAKRKAEYIARKAKERRFQRDVVEVHREAVKKTQVAREEK